MYVSIKLSETTNATKTHDSRVYIDKVMKCCTCMDLIVIVFNRNYFLKSLICVYIWGGGWIGCKAEPMG